MRRYGGGPLEGACRQEPAGSRFTGGHFYFGGVPANGDRSTFGCRDPLGMPEAGVFRACAILRVSGDRILCRGGVRFQVEVVEEGVSSPALAGSAASGGEGE